MKNFKLLVLVSLVMMTTCQKPTEYIVNSDNRNFSVSDFEEIQLGMSYSQVVEIMGEPTGTVGFGIVWEVYGLNDGAYMKMLFTGYNEILTKMIMIDKNGKEIK
ncbi:MAG: hypothetical protein K2O29_00695 [Ruminococcus sp.]|nr:hypothetical protein [Ruminococcus sp.]MDE6849560.1 hypothetical protein [Ruminococcus sp.]MDE7136967.1 hypothetical protein [Ruminococcus sp.]